MLWRAIQRSALLVMVAALGVLPGQAAEKKLPSTADRPPRKVIVGTVVQAFWVDYPGLQTRLTELEGIVDRMAEQAQKQYGRGLDLAILPETVVSGEMTGDIVKNSIPLAGPLQEAFSRKARQLHCYIVVPTNLLEDAQKRLCTNVAILFGRDGEVVGIYRKVHLAIPTGSDSLEGGMTPGKDEPVFQCDFGKLGIQICFDIQFDYGWNELARKGAELVAWPTQSPQTARPAFYALRNRYYVVSSTWRENASIFEPTGRIAAQARQPGEVLVKELDLSYAILPWSGDLRNGDALKEKFGDKVGFNYYVEEDCGIFWSNDPATPIWKMMRSLGLTEAQDELARAGDLYRKAGVPRY